MKNRKNKGEYGYRDYRRKARLVMVGVGVAAILIQLGARGLTDSEAAKNILTVMAVLSVLPTANLASPLLASWRYRTPSKAFYEKVHAHEGEYVILYDLIVTTKEWILPLDAVIVHPKGIYAYCTSLKVEIPKAEKTLNEFLKAQKLDGNLKLIKDEKSFFQRMKELKPSSAYEDDGSVDYAANFLKNMSM